jgi:hypothetical protein
MQQDTGIKIIASFDDLAIPLGKGTESVDAGTRSRNAGINLFPVIESKAQPLTPDPPQSTTPERLRLAARLAELSARIESAVEVIRAASAEFKQIQDALISQKPQNTAG